MMSNITIEQTEDRPKNRRYLGGQDQDFGQPGEEAVGKYFVSRFGQDNVVHWPFGKFDVDFMVKVNGVKRFVDVETRSGPWAAGDWPFGSIHVPSRKWDMIGSRQPFYYFVVRRDLARALIIKGSDILDAHWIDWKGNHETSKQEKYFDVPATQILQYIDLTEEEQDGN
jgi:hypothetical protein